MMDTMIERVSRAICIAAKLDPDRKGNETEFHWQEFVGEAAAAIEAMRTPTQGMIEAGADSYTVDGTYGATEEEISEIYQAMIDAALAAPVGAA